MEFLKTCNTNAQAIGEFEAIAFQSFSVTRNTTPTSSNLSDWSPAEDIRAIEAELRQEQRLVAQDATRPWLWLFQAATVDKAGQQPLDLPVLEGYYCQREQHGVMKASELAQPQTRMSNPSMVPSASANSPATPGPAKGFPGGSGRPPQGSAQLNPSADQQQFHDRSTIYELFTSSVVALISYHLVRDYSAVALNYRTFVSKIPLQQEIDDRKDSSALTPYWLTNINVYWASSGTLLVFTFSLLHPDIHCLDEVMEDEEQKRLIGQCIRVAPNGLLAQIAGFDDPLDNIAENSSQRSRRKKVKVSPTEQGIERWKSAVKRWLACKGYSLPNLDKRTSWARIRIAYMSQLRVSSPAPSVRSHEVLWPRALCFLYDSSMTAETHVDSLQGLAVKQESDALDWFETPDKPGYKDPIDAAQEWFLGKPERDRMLEARRKAKRAEEDATRRKDDNSSLYPSSPLNSRTGAYGDLQAVSGVYPTPPDGVVPGTVVSSSDTPSVSGTAANIILAPGGTNPAINLSVPQDSIQTDGHQQPTTSPEFPLGTEQFNPGSGHDDLFEDMDEDSFEGNGVTDADFNFFDEPDDANDIAMLDAPAIEDSKSTAIEKLTKVKQSSVPSELQVKEEVSDPYAALEDALATASRPDNESKTKNKIEHSQDDQPTGDPDQMDISHPQHSNAKPAVPVSKEPTPPLSPHFVEQILLSSPKQRDTEQKSQKPIKDRHRDSIFDPLSFNQKMSLSDAKYQDGRFNFPNSKGPKQEKQEHKPPPRIKSLRDLPLLTKLRYTIGTAAAKNIPEMASLARADSDYSDSSSETSSVSEEVDDEGVSIGPGPPSAGLIIPAKRKLPTDGHATPMSTTSFAESFSGDFQDFTGLQIDESSLATFEPSTWDWSLVNTPPPTELGLNGTRFSIPSFSPILSSVPNTPTSQPDLTLELPDEKPLSGKDSIAVAQIVTDQIVKATLDLLHESKAITTDTSSRASPESRWQHAIKSIFPNAMECNVASFASVHDVFQEMPSQMRGQQRPLPRKPNEGATAAGHQMHQLNPPFIRVRRADILWDLLPPALSFWEPLGLSPCNPAKNVVAFCIYPHSNSLRPCVDNFLVNVQLAYDNCKLGSHSRVETVPDYEGGLVPCKLNAPVSTRAVFKSLRDTCVQLGKLLAGKHAQMRDKDTSRIDAFVIYIVDPFGSPSSVWELCSAFWTLFQAYGQGPPGRPDQPQKPDLVLQIVPIKYVTSFEVPVVLDSSTYSKLAREVYDRCPPSAPSQDKYPLSIYTAPSFQLEEGTPRQIPFKLHSEPPQDLLRENSYMHLAYAVSLDGTWITAAWTDSWGKSQAVVSYSLGTRPFKDIADEIWQTTIEILSGRRVTWRVCIAKAGVMDREEFEIWAYRTSCPTQLNLFVTLLTVDTEPFLKFTPTIPTTNSSTNPSSIGNPSINTPGSTPQAGVSPDPHGLTPAATPSAENATDPSADPDARLVDITDETWAIILAHRLHNSNSTNEFRPSLISGLLVKRGETYATSPSTHPQIPDPESGPIIVGVNMLYIGAVGSTRAAASPFPPSASGEGVSPGAGPSPTGRSPNSLTWTLTAPTRATSENLLREILVNYRGLGLLAKLKGMRGTRHGTVPWHVAAAMRGVNGVTKCLGT